jgi:hypothetical protein
MRTTLTSAQIASLTPSQTIAQTTSDIPADNDSLIAAITRLAGHINTAQHRFLILLAALIERDAWGDGGAIKSPAHWLNYYCGIDLGAAREKVRVAKSLEQLPQINAAFASGAISYSKVRAMTRSATPQNEAILLNIARHGTAQHVEMLVRKHQRVQRQLYCPVQESGQDNGQDSGQDNGQGNGLGQRANRAADAAAVQFAGRELHWHYDDDGMLVIRGRLTPEDGALFIKAVDGAFAQLHAPSASSNTVALDAQTHDPENASAEMTYSDHHHQVQKHVSAETFSESVGVSDQQETTADTFPQKRADAFMLLIENCLRHNTGDMAPLSPPQHHQMIVHIEKDSLMHGTAHHCSIEHGPFLSPAAARRLACDTGLLTVLEDGQGNVLNVGRKTRTVSPALRRALTRRDHCCRFPGCTESRFVDAHHIQHWCDGGETRLDNLVLLCRRHHRLVHEQGYEIINHVEKLCDGDAQQRGHIEFRRPDRQLLPESLYPQFAEHQAHEESLVIERQHQHMGLHIDQLTVITQWRGERLDYSMAMDAVLRSDAVSAGAA